MDIGGKYPLSDFNGAPNIPGTKYKANENIAIANKNRGVETVVESSSCDNLIFFNIYKPNSTNNTIQIAKNKSRGRIPQPATKSAFDINFSANPNSINPKVTFTDCNQPPDFPKVVINEGTNANTTNGNANAIENPNIPINGPSSDPETTDCTNKVPIIIAVHENETNTRVNAIKNILANPELVSAFLSIKFTQLEGNTNSKAPKNEIANNKKIAKSTLNSGLELRFVMHQPLNTTVISKPKQHKSYNRNSIERHVTHGFCLLLFYKHITVIEP